jgi:hypothetical protein
VNIEVGIGANLLAGEAFKIIVARPTRYCRRELSFVRFRQTLARALCERLRGRPLLRLNFFIKS